MRIHTIVVISNRTQWSECITEGMLGIPRNNNWTMPGVARPPSLHSQSYHRKYDVFSSLPQPHSVGKPSKQRRDVIRQELKDVGVPEDKRYDIATTSKVTWYTICHISVRELQQSDLTDKPPNQAECRSMWVDLQDGEWHKEAQVYLRKTTTYQWSMSRMPETVC